MAETMRQLLWRKSVLPGSYAPIFSADVVGGKLKINPGFDDPDKAIGKPNGNNWVHLSYRVDGGEWKNDENAQLVKDGALVGGPDLESAFMAAVHSLMAYANSAYDPAGPIPEGVPVVVDRSGCDDPGTPPDMR